MTGATGRARRVTLAALGTIATLGVLAARRIRRVEITGASMRPTLEPGDRILVVRGCRRPRAGDIVAFPDPRFPRRTMVKRVEAVDGARCAVRGDNPAASTDGRHFGPIDIDSVIGRLWYRYAPEARRGAIGSDRPASWWQRPG